MKHVAALASLVALLGLAHVVWADPNDLSNGVMVIHAVPHPDFCSWSPCDPEWMGVSECQDVVPRADYEPDYPPVSLHVIAFWNEVKQFSVFAFGFGDFDPEAFYFVDWAPCDPGTQVLEFPTTNWPGPNEGTTVGWTGTPWVGDMVPLYWFGGYIYYEEISTTIPIDVNPGENPPLCGFVNCLTPPEVFPVDPENRGVLGINTDGYAPCPGEPVRVCCVGPECYLVTEDECADLGGDFMPDLDSCEPNPCTTGAEEATWSAIKALYK